MAPGRAIGSRAVHPATDRPSATVLVADDSATVRAVVAVELEAAGYRVLEAGDGLTAVAGRSWPPDTAAHARA